MFRALPQLPRRLAARDVRRTCSSLLLAAALPCAAATPAQVFNVIVTADFVKREQCTDTGMLVPHLLNGLKHRPGDNGQPTLSREQVRAIAARYDDIIDQRCRTVLPLLSNNAVLASHYEKSNALPATQAGWNRFLADETAVEWAALAATLRTELVALHNVVNLQTTLRLDVFNPEAKHLPDFDSPETQRLLEEIHKVSLTSEEALARFALAILSGERAFREMMPARFDIERLARAEAQTRRLGLQLAEKHGVNLSAVYNEDTRRQLFATMEAERERELNNAFFAAAAQVDVLAEEYRYR